MILRIEEIQDICSKVLQALDSKDVSEITETLLIESVPNKLTLYVSNGDYGAEVSLNTDSNESFKATVNANLFLKLVAQTTTDTIEFSIKDNSLIVKGNGTYTLPLIFTGDKLLELPRIELNNVTSEFDIDGDILNSLLFYNAKQFDMGVARAESMNYYYLDNKGCVTANVGACVNNFELNGDCKILLNKKLVKLFRLFKKSVVRFRVAHDVISENENTFYTKASFESNDVKINAILYCDDTLLNSFPEPQVRAIANKDYDYSVTLNKRDLSNAINRMLLFSNTKERFIGNLTFTTDKIFIKDISESSVESLFYYDDVTGITDSYSANIDFSDFKKLLDTCDEQFVTVSFGDHRAIVVTRANVRNIIPECVCQ